MPKNNTKKKKEDKKYIVTCDVFFMDSCEVEAKNKKEAFEKAKEEISGRYGKGEEITLYEIELLQ